MFITYCMRERENGERREAVCQMLLFTGLNNLNHGAQIADIDLL